LGNGTSKKIGNVLLSVPNSSPGQLLLWVNGNNNSYYRSMNFATSVGLKSSKAILEFIKEFKFTKFFIQ